MTERTARSLRRALMKAIVLLTERREITTSRDEKDEIDIELPKLEAKWQLVHEAILAGSLAPIRQPSGAEIENMMEGSRALDDVSARNTRARAILALVSAAAEIVTT